MAHFFGKPPPYYEVGLRLSGFRAFRVKGLGALSLGFEGADLKGSGASGPLRCMPPERCDYVDPHLA